MKRYWLAALATAISLGVSFPALAGQRVRADRFYDGRNHSQIAFHTSRLNESKAQVRADLRMIRQINRDIARDLARHDRISSARDHARLRSAKAAYRRDLHRVDEFARLASADRRDLASSRRMYRTYRR